MPGWINCNDELPEPDDKITLPTYSKTVIVGVAGDERIELAYYDFTTNQWQIITNLNPTNPIYHYDITHWQELPTGVLRSPESFDDGDLPF